MDGNKFLKLLAKRSIPASTLAVKAKINLDKVYALKDKQQVPSRYRTALLEHFADQLKARDVEKLTSMGD